MIARILPETYILVPEQLMLFGGACLLGIPAGMLWDLFRLLRILFPHHSLVTAAEDVLYFGALALMLMCYIYAFALCDFRFCYPVGMGLGFVLYECLIGCPVISLLRRCRRFVCKKIPPR